MELWWQTTSVSTEHQVKKCRRLMGFSVAWISILTAGAHSKTLTRIREFSLLKLMFMLCFSSVIVHTCTWGLDEGKARKKEMSLAKEKIPLLKFLVIN